MKTIAIGLSPNTQADDVLLAYSQIITPWQYKDGNYIKDLEDWFRNFFDVQHATSFVSARGALFAILKSLNIGKGDEVILQAFTCVAVVEAILQVGATPKYVDIEKDLTLSILSLKKAISKKTKAIIAQHTFGIPAKIDEIQKVAKENNLFLIEDCAHGIGGVYKGKKLGMFGIASIFSFGRDKAFSSVFGGIVITSDSSLQASLQKFHNQQTFPTHRWIAQQLFHPIATSLILPIYAIGIVGKGMLFMFQKLNMLSLPVLNVEKQGVLPQIYTKKLPNSLAALALHQLKKIDLYNKKRQKFTRQYIDELENFTSDIPYRGGEPLLRFPVLVANREQILALFKKQHIYLGTWYSCIIDPKGVDFSKILYEKGMCPEAELVSSKIVNLPLLPNMSTEDVEKIVSLFKKYAGSKRN